MRERESGDQLELTGRRRSSVCTHHFEATSRFKYSRFRYRER